MSALDHYNQQFSGLAGELPGHNAGWLTEIRSHAMTRFSELGFPTTRNEDWKYTKVAAIEKRSFDASGKNCVGLVEEDLEPYLYAGLDAHRMVFLNGRFSPSLSDLGSLPKGAVLASLGKTLAENPEPLKPYLARLADTGRNGFSAMNTAFMGDGLYLHLGAGTVLDRPIQLLFLATSQEQEGMANLRNLIVAGDNSQATVIETYASMGEGVYLTNAVTEVELAAGANISHYKIQEESAKAYHVATLQAHQQRDSRFTSHSVSLGGLLVRNDINSVLDGEGAECTLNGLYMADGRQHTDYHTRVEHAKPHCSSGEFYKGVLGGRARGVFNGQVVVRPDASKSDAQQSNANLLLSKDAEIDTKPQLEIYNDDVKAAHGATVGQLDEDMLFYLRTRGIAQEAARGLLTYGFAHDLVERMELEPVRRHLEEVLVTRVPAAQHVKEMV